MAGSVRNYAVLYFGAGRSRGGGVAVGGGNVLSSTPTHKLDGIEHAAADDSARLDATVDRHGLLPKLSGDVTEALRGDGTFGGFDHGGLSGLGDDDHPQYTTDAEAAVIAAAAVSAYAQPLDSDLTAFAGLAIAADTLPYGTGSHTLGLTPLTAAGRALIDDATAGDQRTTLGLGTMAVEAKTITTQDDLLVGGSAGALARLAKGSDGQVLTVDPTTHHLVWATPSAGFSNPMTTKGDVIVGDTGGSPIRKAVGTDGQVLTADASSTGGIKWSTSAVASLTTPLKPSSLNGTYGDDYDGPTLDAKWTRRNRGSGSGPYEVFVGSAIHPWAVNARDWGDTQAFTDKDEFEVRVDASIFQNETGEGWGPAILSSAGTGIFLAYRETSRLGFFPLTTFAAASAEPSGSNSGLPGAHILGGGRRSIWSVIKRKCGGTDYYFWRVSLGLTYWDIDFRAGYAPTSFTPALIGWWQGVQNASGGAGVTINWFDVIGALNLGNNVIATPSSGTVTLSHNIAGSTGGTLSSIIAGSSEFYWTSGESPDRYVEAAFSVNQTINRVRIKTRNDPFGAGYVQTSDGTITPFMLTTSSAWHYVDLPASVSTSYVRVYWGKLGTGVNPGFNKIEAYLAS